MANRGTDNSKPSREQGRAAAPGGRAWPRYRSQQQQQGVTVWEALRIPTWVRGSVDDSVEQTLFIGDTEHDPFPHNILVSFFFPKTWACLWAHPKVSVLLGWGRTETTAPPEKLSAVLHCAKDQVRFWWFLTRPRLLISKWHLLEPDTFGVYVVI